ncbi:aspartate carbamoyltransferase [Caldivirga sp. UBA161]|uniref:aspartate carbamoyltransferase n=1 Tax=Caldivirga sp. UBA161 TaxID=1915569 RepID=UPI0025BB7CCF|nr:aspartate carbamoyltransferase [Caldivirga sp. UBA161]
MTWLNRDVISSLDFNREDLMQLFNEAQEMENYAKSKLNILDGKIMATAFFEPSTRTRLSFEAAMLRLGGRVLGFGSVEASSVAKGESLGDTIRMLDSYSDVIVIRHSLEGAAKYAADIATVPVINAGDGTQNHPTQAMLDAYTIWREYGRIDDLTIGILGDLRYARVVTSLIQLLSNFKVKLRLISPEILKPRRELLDFMNMRGMSYSLHLNLNEVLSELDVLYVVRIQRERFPDPVEYERVKGSFKVSPESLIGVKDTLIVLHPLPRVDEVDHRLDSTRYAKYFKQSALGVPLRMALLKLILKGD